MRKKDDESATNTTAPKATEKSKATKKAKPTLLDEDMITAYGTIKESEEITRALTGTNEEVFTINMKYVKLHKE